VVRGASKTVSILGAPSRSRDDWLQKVRGIQSWQAGGLRAPHKPLLLLYAFGRLQRTGEGTVSFEEAATPLKELLREYSPTGQVLHPECPCVPS